MDDAHLSVAIERWKTAWSLALGFTVSIPDNAVRLNIARKIALSIVDDADSISYNNQESSQIAALRRRIETLEAKEAK